MGNFGNARKTLLYRKNFEKVKPKNVWMMAIIDERCVNRMVCMKPSVIW